jgi:SAM-dependent methyltransferase
MHPKKRWIAVATLAGSCYTLHPPQLVGDAATLFVRLSARAGKNACVLAGFDFPIGVPIRYAARAGIRSFREVLPQLGHGEWSRFYDVAESRGQINSRRPFYPQRPGGTAMSHLLDGLGVATASDLLRRCDRGYPGRPAAAPVFWTMGAKQVGKATITGWRDLLSPALRSSGVDVALWPFDGGLDELLASKRVVIAETYPAEFYNHLGLRFGSKRCQEDRASTAPTLLRWTEDNAVALTAEMSAAIRDGFGDRRDGEDPFDAAVGLFGMLGVVLGNRPTGEPDLPSVKRVEGWMFGQREASTKGDKTASNSLPAAANEPRAEDVATDPTEYDPLADLYDLEYTHDYDVGFWLSAAEGQPGPVVEWGAGTGRITIPLSRAGGNVTAIELSRRMVERGRAKGENVEWVVGDMRTAKLDRRFGLAICAFNSLLCLPTAEDVLAFLRNAREHLLPGGLLGVEVSAFSPEELADTQGGVPLQHDFTRETPDGWLDRFSVSRYDATSRVMEMRLFYELYGDDGGLQSRRAHDLAIRITGRDELQTMLRHAGFRIESVYGGFEREPFTAESNHLIVLSRNADPPAGP